MLLPFLLLSRQGDRSISHPGSTEEKEISSLHAEEMQTDVGLGRENSHGEGG